MARIDWNPSQHVNNVDRLVQIAAKHVLLNIGLDEKGVPVTTVEKLRQFRPIGVVLNFNVAQNKMTQRIFEIGSGKSFIATGPTIAVFTATRALIMGPTFMGILKHGTTHTPPESYNPKTFIFDLSDPVFDRPYLFVVMFYSPTVTQNVEEDVSSIQTLASSREIIGAIALEGCVLSAHNVSVNAGDVLVFENVNFEAEGVRDLNVSFRVALPPSNLATGGVTA